MRKLILLGIAVATFCALALGAFAVAHRVVRPVADDVIVIKGGSLEIECPPNQDKACLGTADVTTGKYKHTKDTDHITQIVVKDSTGKALYTKTFSPSAQPSIEVTYK